jgi:hypothetical protein
MPNVLATKEFPPMSPMKTLLLPVFAALLLGAAAFAADPAPAAPAYGPGMGMGMGAGLGPSGCFGVMRALPLEERLMHFKEMHPANMGSMTVDHYLAWRKAKCDKLLAMTPAERQKYAVELKAKWDALPDSEKVQLYQKFMDRRTGMRGRGMGPGRGMRGGPGGW